MAPIDFGQFSYVPILSVRPAEMHALEEMLPADKDNILPYIVLQRWTTAHHFENTIAKVEAAVGHRPVIVDLTDDIYTGTTRRPVHDTLDGLRNPVRGCESWYEFVEEHENYIPSVQLRDPAQIAAQAAKIQSLNRGGVIRLREEMFRFADQIAAMFRRTRDSSKLYFILDYQRQNRELLVRASGAIELANTIRSVVPDSYFSVSASTFPESFVDLTEQAIFERRFHHLVVDEIGETNTIYCDHASVRAEREGGGGGQPAPRIDNALPTAWHFFREPDLDDRDEAYQTAATNAISADSWNDLGVWGTELIKTTAAGEANGIASPARSTAARINIHMHVQRHHGGDPTSSVESPWTD